MPRILTLVAVILLSACAIDPVARTQKGLSSLAVGQPRTTATNVMGHPITSETFSKLGHFKEVEVLSYPIRKRTTIVNDVRYDYMRVVIAQGRVVGWGEKILLEEQQALSN